MNLRLNPSTERMKTSLLLALVASIALLGASCNREPDPPPFTASTSGEGAVLGERPGRPNPAMAGTGLAQDGGPSEVAPKNDSLDLSDETGWQDDEISPSELGAKIDEAMRNLTMTWGEAATDIADKRPGGGTLNGRSDVKIQDSQTFSIHYHMPRMTARNWIVSNGTTRARLEDGVWSDLPTFRSSNRSPRLSESEVLSWPEQFPRRMFQHFSDNKDHWAPLLKAWENKVAGYEVVVTKALLEQNGREVPFVRIEATRSGEPLTEIEVIIHGETFLPLTIHVSVGSEDTGLTMRWRAKWNFGGTFTDKDFVIPPFQK